MAFRLMPVGQNLIECLNTVLVNCSWFLKKMVLIQFRPMPNCQNYIYYEAVKTNKQISLGAKMCQHLGLVNYFLLIKTNHSTRLKKPRHYN